MILVRPAEAFEVPSASLSFYEEAARRIQAYVEKSIRSLSTRATERPDMSAADKLGGYANGFGELNADVVAANVTADYKLLDKDGKVYGKGDLPGYIAELRKLGNKMDITDVVVEGSTAWCKWQLGDIVGAGMITFGDEGVSEEQLFYA